MPLTGQAKTDYQREYMRKRRSNQATVRPERDSVRPEVQGITEQQFNERVAGIYDVPIKFEQQRLSGPLTKERQVSQRGFND